MQTRNFFSFGYDPAQLPQMLQEPKQQIWEKSCDLMNSFSVACRKFSFLFLFWHRSRPHYDIDGGISSKMSSFVAPHVLRMCCGMKEESCLLRVFTVLQQNVPRIYDHQDDHPCRTTTVTSLDNQLEIKFKLVQYCFILHSGLHQAKLENWLTFSFR